MSLFTRAIAKAKVTTDFSCLPSAARLTGSFEYQVKLEHNFPDVVELSDGASADPVALCVSLLAAQSLFELRTTAHALAFSGALHSLATAVLDRIGDVSDFSASRVLADTWPERRIREGMPVEVQDVFVSVMGNVARPAQDHFSMDRRVHSSVKLSRDGAFEASITVPPKEPAELIALASFSQFEDVVRNHDFERVAQPLAATCLLIALEADVEPQDELFDHSEAGLSRREAKYRNLVLDWLGNPEVVAVAQSARQASLPVEDVANAQLVFPQSASPALPGQTAEERLEAARIELEREVEERGLDDFASPILLSCARAAEWFIQLLMQSTAGDSHARGSEAARIRGFFNSNGDALVAIRELTWLFVLVHLSGRAHSRVFPWDADQLDRALVRFGEALEFDANSILFGRETAKWWSERYRDPGPIEGVPVEFVEEWFLSTYSWFVLGRFGLDTSDVAERAGVEYFRASLLESLDTKDVQIIRLGAEHKSKLAAIPGTWIA